ILKQWVPSWKFAVSYITGAHALKVGINDKIGHTYFKGFSNTSTIYRFNNGIPNQLTDVAFPFERIADVGADMGVCAQDKSPVNGDATFRSDANPVQNLVNSTTRTWTDTNRNFVPECNLTDPAANGECGAMANRDFGGVRIGSTYDPYLLRGWGKRNYNWEFS